MQVEKRIAPGACFFFVFCFLFFVLCVFLDDVDHDNVRYEHALTDARIIDM
jgi:hypothetical protein